MRKPFRNICHKGRPKDLSISSFHYISFARPSIWIVFLVLNHELHFTPSQSNQKILQRCQLQLPPEKRNSKPPTILSKPTTTPSKPPTMPSKQPIPYFFTTTSTSQNYKRNLASRLSELS
jgi:hypothetical protein